MGHLKRKDEERTVRAVVLCIVPHIEGYETLVAEVNVALGRFKT